MIQLMPLPLTVSCFIKIHIGFTFMVPAHPSSPGKRAVKGVCVCVYYLIITYQQCRRDVRADRLWQHRQRLSELSSPCWSSPRGNHPAAAQLTCSTHIQPFTGPLSGTTPRVAEWSYFKNWTGHRDAESTEGEREQSGSISLPAEWVDYEVCGSIVAPQAASRAEPRPKTKMFSCRFYAKNHLW